MMVRIALSSPPGVSSSIMKARALSALAASISAVMKLAIIGLIIAGGLGARAVDLLQQHGIAVVVGAPVVAVMASYLPTLSAVSQDPAIVLMDN